MVKPRSNKWEWTGLIVGLRDGSGLGGLRFKFGFCLFYLLDPDLVLVKIKRTKFVISANLRDWFCNFTKVLIGTKIDKDA